MKILFCSDALEPTRPDAAYEAEVGAANAAGLDFVLLDFEALTHDGNISRALRRVKAEAEPTTVVYRGWMLRPAIYNQLFDALNERNLRLINSAAAYRHCHWLPEWYPVLEGRTPRSIWLKWEGALPVEEILASARNFGDVPLIVKDYVKSRKHEWNEACFIPSATDAEAVERVTRRFIEGQGAELNEGLVLREFVPFEPLASHSRSAMPLTKEFRVFVLDGEPLQILPYWQEGDYGALQPPLEELRSLAANIQSRFFTMDVAQRRDGVWMVVELGDGQVAGLPDQTGAASFYRSLAERNL